MGAGSVRPCFSQVMVCVSPLLSEPTQSQLVCCSCHAPCPGPQDKNRGPHQSEYLPTTCQEEALLGRRGREPYPVLKMSLLVLLASPEAPEVLSQSVMSMVPSTRLGPNSTASSNIPLPKHSQDFWAPQKGPRQGLRSLLESRRGSLGAP